MTSVNFTSDVNSSHADSDVDSIGNIIFKGILNPAGSVNGSYYQYLVNQSQVEMGVPNKGKTIKGNKCCHRSLIVLQ